VNDSQALNSQALNSQALNYQVRLQSDFSNAAQTYGELATIQNLNYARIFEFLAQYSTVEMRAIVNEAVNTKYLKDKKKFLDIGIGEGSGLLTNAKPWLRNFECIGVDASWSMLAQLQHNQNRQVKSLLTVQPLCADMHQLPLPSNSVDFGISNFALHWAQDLNHVVQEIYRVMAKKGIIVLSFPVLGSLNELTLASQKSGVPINIHEFPSFQQVIQYLAINNFNMVQAEVAAQSIEFDSGKQLLQWFKATGARAKNSQANVLTKTQVKQLVTQLEQTNDYQKPRVSFELAFILATKNC